MNRERFRDLLSGSILHTLCIKVHFYAKQGKILRLKEKLSLQRIPSQSPTTAPAACSNSCFRLNELANIRDDEVTQFKKAAKHILNVSDAHIGQLINNGQLEEVKHDNEKISH